MRRRLVLLVLCLFVALPIAAAAKGGKAIWGFVGRSSTEAAGNFTVKLMDGETGKTLDIVETNWAGKYKFEDVAPGHYVIHAGDIKREIMLKEKDKDKRLDIDLSVKDGSMSYVDKKAVEDLGKSLEDQPKGGKAPVGAAPPAGGAAGGDPDAVAFFRGCMFKDIRGSGETKYYFYADGRFAEYSDTVYSGRMTDGFGVQTGAYGVGGASQGQGTWSVKGRKDAGVFVIRYQNGSTRQIPYQVFVEKGQTYWGEFKVDGIHMTKTPIE